MFCFLQLPGFYYSSRHLPAPGFFDVGGFCKIITVNDRIPRNSAEIAEGFAISINHFGGHVSSAVSGIEGVNRIPLKGVFVNPDAVAVR